LGPHHLQFLNPKLTTAQAAASLKPVIDFIATLNPSIVQGSNTVYELPSYGNFYNNVILPYHNVSQDYPFSTDVLTVWVTFQVGTGTQGNVGGRFIHKKNFATEQDRKDLLEAVLTVYEKSSGAAATFSTPYNYNGSGGSTSVHPGLVTIQNHPPKDASLTWSIIFLKMALSCLVASNHSRWVALELGCCWTQGKIR
jgi:hypothetical protein